nr:MAG TPA: hypothetical protein [Caudoviricetes sp.]
MNDFLVMTICTIAVMFVCYKICDDIFFGNGNGKFVTWIFSSGAAIVVVAIMTQFFRG